MKSFVNVVACLLLAATAAAQSNPQTPALKTRPSTQNELPVPDNPSITPDTPVITIQGLCEKPAGSSATPSDCKTVVTRADFEKVAPPNLPGPQKKRVADQFVQALLLAEKAHEAGQDKGPEYEKQMYIFRLKLLASLAYQELQKEVSSVSDAEIQDYYDKHKGDYKSISFDRLYVPKQKAVQSSADKPDTAELQKKREASEAEMKAEADKLRARAAAGEDFKKLQQEAYDVADVKQTAQSTKQEDVRKSGVLASDASIFELKQGDVSQVFNDPAGFMVYKIEGVKDLPMASVHDEIARMVQADKLKNAMDTMTGSVKTTLDDAYFATPAPPTLRNPGEKPSAQTNPPPHTVPSKTNPGKQ